MVEEKEMITNIVSGDITSPKNNADIIIGMNVTLNDVTGIGLPFVRRVTTPHPLTLGGVMSFRYSGVQGRQIHMLLCHAIGGRRWHDADRYVRFGMDFLWHIEPERKYSIVRIGTGRVGLRDGADAVAIHTAMSNSYLPVVLYLYNQETKTPAHAAELIPFRSWTPKHGAEEVRVA